MTHEEKLIISAYMGRPVWTHEMVSDKFCETLREKLKPKFLELCKK